MTNKTQHTPGPWKLTNCTLYGATLTGRIATLHSGDDASFDANKKLIAAAPELLEALKFGLKELDFGGEPSTPIGHSIRKFQKIAQQAINKAEGNR